MAARDDGGRRTEAAVSDRDTWLCRSTIGAGSDGEDDDRWSELSAAADDGDEAGGSDVVESTAVELPAAPTPVDVQKPKEQSRGRRLTLGGHLDVARAHALRKAMPPLATPIDVSATTTDRSHAKKRQDHKRLSTKMAMDRDSVSMRMKKKKQSDDHLTIYMDYDREPGFGKTPKPLRHRREEFVVRRIWCVHATLFLSTACVHCISFNASPGLRRLFGIDALPVGLCIVVAWTILGLVNCVGACLSGSMDRVTLLRRLAWLWIVAIVALQLTKLLPVPAVAANTLLALGYSAAVVAHGLLLPNLIALGAKIVTNEAASTTKSRPRRRVPCGSVDAAMSSFITWAFAVMLLSSSLPQAFYFAAVDLELPAGQEVLILRSRRAVLITLPCGVSLLALLTTFLFQSRHHASAQQLAAEAEKLTIETPRDTTEPRNPLERKLARGELDTFPHKQPAVAQPTTLGWRDWLRLGRHSAALLALAFFTLLLVIAVASALIAHAVTSSVPSPILTASSLSPSSSTLVHLVIFAVLFVGWLMTMLLSASQLAPAPRDKLYAAVDDAYTDSEPLLPSRQQLFVVVALICLACAATFAAFVRAQLYSAMFVQTCQLRRPSDSAFSALFDPNVLGAVVGLVSVLVLPSLRFLLRTKKTKMTTNASQPPRLSAARRVTLGVLLYVSAIFFSSIVELYRRDSRLRSVDIVNPAASHCAKTQPSSLAVLWSVPHLVVLALADALFRVGAAEEAYTLTAPLEWLGVSQAVLSLADSIGYAVALALSKTLSSWLYRVQTSDLVLLLLMVTALASLAYALTRRLASHLHASRRCQQLQQDQVDDEEALSQEDDQEHELNEDDKIKMKIEAMAAQHTDELTIKAVRGADRHGSSLKAVSVPASSSTR